MAHDANPCEEAWQEKRPSKQTFEYRVADGSADPYLTVAGLIVASLHGIEMPNALEMAERLYVSGNIFRPEFGVNASRSSSSSRPPVSSPPRRSWQSVRSLRRTVSSRQG